MAHDFVCASCSRPVSEGHCAVCRSYRRQSSPPPLWLLLALLAVASLVSLALTLRPA